MATIQRAWDTLDTSTFLDGGSEASVTDAGVKSEHILLDQWEGVHCYVDANFSGTTDDLVIEVLSSPNATTTSEDNIPIFSFTIDKVNDPGKTSFIVTDIYSFRVNFKASGNTDSINIIFRYRRWRWESV